MTENRQYITVSELNSFLSHFISQDERLTDVAIVGEVSGVKIVRGHMYCTIKDKNSSFPFIVFNVKSFEYMPVEGDKILAIGYVNLYEKTGKLSFLAQYMEPFGIGKLYAEFEALKKKLQEAGYFNEVYKKAIPLYPLRVGIVTSKQGAVIKDIVRTIRNKNHLINIELIDVNVQGENAQKEIVAGLQLADSQNYDVVILARGGGSFEDLMPFNTEVVANTIFKMKTCIISAIGHETDFTISDFVADHRASTPTAAGELVGFSIQTLINDIRDILMSFDRNIKLKIYKGQQRMLSKCKDIEYAADKKISNYHHLISRYIEKIKILNPNNMLRKGYFIAKKNGIEVYDAKDFSIGDKINIIGHDSIVTTEVTKVEKRNEWGVLWILKTIY